MTWYLVKHRDNITFTFMYTYLTAFPPFILWGERSCNKQCLHARSDSGRLKAGAQCTVKYNSFIKKTMCGKQYNSYPRVDFADARSLCEFVMAVSSDTVPCKDVTRPLAGSVYFLHTSCWQVQGYRPEWGRLCSVLGQVALWAEKRHLEGSESQSYYYCWRSVSPSIRLDFEPLTRTHCHTFAFRENFVFVCRGASTLTGGRVPRRLM
jgi:hypothetical protein